MTQRPQLGPFICALLIKATWQTVRLVRKFFHRTSTRLPSRGAATSRLFRTLSRRCSIRGVAKRNTKDRVKSRCMEDRYPDQSRLIGVAKYSQHLIHKYSDTKRYSVSPLTAFNFSKLFLKVEFGISSVARGGGYSPPHWPADQNAE